MAGHWENKTTAIITGTDTGGFAPLHVSSQCYDQRTSDKGFLSKQVDGTKISRNGIWRSQGENLFWRKGQGLLARFYLRRKCNTLMFVCGRS